MSPTQTAAMVAVNPAAVPIALQVFGEERLAILKEQLGRGWPEPMTDAELEHIGLVCQRTRLDPLAKPAQIYFIKRKDTRLQKYVMTPQVSIDGLRLVAQRSRQYGGQVGPLFCGPDGVWREFWLDPDNYPTAAKVGVWRRGFKEPLWSVATWREWAQYENEWGGPENNRRIVGKKLTTFWETKGAHMLGKTAEAMSLKRAFPEETNELELASLEQEARAEIALNAQRHVQIFGRDEDGSAFADPPQQPALHAGHVVDAQTGEVLVEAPYVPPRERQDLQDASRGDPRLAELQRLRALANERGLAAPGIQPVASESPIDDAIAYWRQRIENHDLDQIAAQQQAPF